ncbi:MAG TPA: aminoglycoside phosphotransferase [Deltaproteobacteria bacterium]|nr:aminoglycoside phosphotransferase [Deltaproteobacteria bacterium]
MSDEQLIAAMSKPGFYPHKPVSVELVQTHISCVFIAGNLVYKVKKPVDFGFLDFTTLEKRKFYCTEELRLNKRLAPSIYLHVAPISKNDGGYYVPGEGKNVVDYAVVMKKLPPDKMLKTMLAKGQADESVMDAVAEKIARFHSNAQTGGRINEMGSIKTISHNHEENFDQTKKYIGATITSARYHFIKDYVQGFLFKNKPLFEKRVIEKKIRDCHGDLHLEHICVTDDIVIYDCIEFNERFRFADVAAEVAFLTMDLDFNGYHAFAETFARHYLKYSGDNDMTRLLNFYRCYYAYVRGKVTSFRLDQEGITEKERQDISQIAAKYFELSYLYAARLEKPALILTAGLMGSGKSYQARTLGRALGAEVIRTDVLRKELSDIEPTQAKHENFGQGIYSDEASRRTYEKIYELAAQIIKQGKPVIIDASFKKRSERKKAYALARNLGVGFYVIECVCPDDTTRKRLEKRAREKNNVSDGRWEIFHEQKKDFEAIDEISPKQHFKIDTSAEPEAARLKIIEKIKKFE